ncbi:hypothetical protein [Vallitalea maricola]|uniref:Uncharacterized protein n=1 Tax=Vallitalea maricola TaxID=3074433 RepID=A0ACB5UPR4_9FIRM|nr:hypothetical protein AN2V17_38380 [Vallitalea sp. AN17-2]
MSIPFIKGTTTFQSSLSIVEVGAIISQKVFGGLVLKGLEKRIYDEVPIIFINSEILGLRVVLSGYSGYSEGNHFVLQISPHGFSKKFGKFVKNDIQEIKLNEYLKQLMEYYFTNDGREDVLRSMVID